jgi:hypothetical protein
MGTHAREARWRRCLLVCARAAAARGAPRALRGPLTAGPFVGGGALLSASGAAAGEAFAAAWRGDAAALRAAAARLRAAGGAAAAAAVLDAPDAQGRRPLLFAAGYGRVDAVAALCDAGGAAVDAGAGGAHGTALLRAARFGHGAAAQALLLRGADPLARDAAGTPAPAPAPSVCFNGTAPRCAWPRPRARALPAPAPHAHDPQDSAPQTWLRCSATRASCTCSRPARCCPRVPPRRARPRSTMSAPPPPAPPPPSPCSAERSEGRGADSSTRDLGPSARQARLSVRRRRPLRAAVVAGCAVGDGRVRSCAARCSGGRAHLSARASRAPQPARRLRRPRGVFVPTPPTAPMPASPRPASCRVTLAPPRALPCRASAGARRCTWLPATDTRAHAPCCLRGARTRACATPAAPQRSASRAHRCGLCAFECSRAQARGRGRGRARARAPRRRSAAVGLLLLLSMAWSEEERVFMATVTKAVRARPRRG